MQIKTMNGMLPNPVMAERCKMFCMPTSFPEWKAPNFGPHTVQVCSCQRNDSNDVRTMICVKCKYLQEYTVEELQNHYREKHSSDTPAFVCSKCGFVAVETQQVNMPALSCLVNKYTEANSINYNHMSNGEYYSHINNGSYYNLMSNGDYFSHVSNGDYYRHVNNGDYYRAAKYDCDKCRFTTKDALHFKRHIIQHDEIKFTCSYCNHVSYTRGEFQRHLVIHTGTFPFKCHYCDYGAVRNDYVMKHIKRVHEAMQTKMQMSVNTLNQHNLEEQKSKSTVNQKQKIAYEELKEVCFPCDKEYMKTTAHEGRVNLWDSNNGNLPVKDSVQVEVLDPLDKVQPGMPLTVVAPSDLVVPDNCLVQLVEMKTVNGSQQLVLKFIPREDADCGKGTSGNWNTEECLTGKDNCSNKECSTSPDGPFSNTVTNASMTSKIGTLVSRSEPEHKNGSAVQIDCFTNAKYVQQSVLSNISESPVHSFFKADEGSEKQANMLVHQNPINSAPKLINLTKNNSDFSMHCIPCHPKTNEKPLLPLPKNVEKTEALAICGGLQKQSEYLPGVGQKQLKLNLNKERLSPFIPAGETPSSGSLKGLLSATALGSKCRSPKQLLSQESGKPAAYPEHAVSKHFDLPPDNENCTVPEGPVIMSVFSLNSSNSSSSQNSWNQNKSIRKPQRNCTENQNSKLSISHGAQLNNVENKSQRLDENLFQPTQQNTNCCLGERPVELLRGRKRIPADVYQSLEERICNLKERLSHSFIIPSFARRTSNPPCQSVEESIRLTAATAPSPTNPQVTETSCGISNTVEAYRGQGQMQNDVNLNCTNSTKQQLWKTPASGSDLKSSFVSNSFKRGIGVAQNLENALQQKSVTQPDSVAFMNDACQTLVTSEVSNSVNKQTSSEELQKTETAFPVLGEQQCFPLENVASVDLGCNAQKADAGLNASLGPKRVHFGSVSVSSEGNEKPLLNCDKKVSDKQVCFKVAAPILRVKSSSKACELSASVSPEPCCNMDEITGKKGVRSDAIKTVYAPVCTPSVSGDYTEINVHAQLCSDKNVEVLALNENEDPSNNFCPSSINHILKNGTMSNFGKPFIYAYSLKTNDAAIAQTDTADVETLQNVGKNKVKEGNVHVATPVFIPKGTVLKVLRPNKTAHCQSREGRAFSASADWKPEIFLPRPVPCSSATVNSLQESEMLDKSRLRSKVSPRDAKHSIVATFGANGKTARISVDRHHCMSSKNTITGVNQKRRKEHSLNANFNKYPFWQKAFKPNIRMVSSFLHARHLRLRSPLKQHHTACPYQTQPLVVLNHPDVDTPEVINVMKTLKNYESNIVKVFLTEKTMYRLCLKLQNRKRLLYKCCKTISILNGQQVLKMKLKKTHKNGYHIVQPVRSDSLDDSSSQTFPCWFCGRIYFNQEEWISHGQRHLMEATRNWDVLPKVQK
ncbi:zinc finger protein 518B [Protopterus annectens]|uniref:zinc finger protein 518B n=1 Tax=Protopterus annectens TaxID=7888 RepID=UPI001CFA1EF2|nr:zinc finger protein 518B [Protopterus annectens]XP_043918526.1 zinc finger protein 518B [Protopterus annectens]